MIEIAHYIEQCGGAGALIANWTVTVTLRISSDGSGERQGSDTYYFDEYGQKFRAKTEVARHFGLTPLTHRRVRPRDENVNIYQNGNSNSNNNDHNEQQQQQQQQQLPNSNQDNDTEMPAPSTTR